MIKPFRTVKTRIIALMLCFVTLISIIVVAFSLRMMRDFQTETLTQSATFNLELVSGAIESDLVELVALANWCGYSTNPGARYLAGTYSAAAAMQAFFRLQEEVRYSRAGQYVDRVMVVDPKTGRALHTGKNTTNIRAFTSEDLSVLAQWPLGSGATLYDIGRDPFSRYQTDVINILAPVYSPLDYSVIGTVYLAASAAVITDKLREYRLEEGDGLYLTIQRTSYRISPDGGIVRVNAEEALAIREAQESAAPGLYRISTADGAELNAIDCAVRDGVTLTHVFADEALLPLSDTWLLMLMGICAAILTLALITIAVLHYLISRPVARIRRKIDEIVLGDFSRAPEIESDSEIGAVGRGINRLSRNVVDLMETRLADEKNKRELEYRMLQSQVNPHFLYNTLGAIKWMATLQKAEGIAEMTTALSRLLKTVAKDVRKVVSLREELSLLDDYYTILKYRYGGAVDYTRDIESDDLLDSVLPRFVLQPLMENAIFHGIEPKGSGRITLTAARDGGDVRVTMQDDGVGMDEARIASLLSDDMPDEKASSYSLGIRSVHARIRNVFGQDYGLRIESEPGAYTRMIIRIPWDAKESTS